MVVDGDRVVVAVSGGVDSVVLLHVFHRLAGAFRLSLVACHVDHGIRPTSREDLRFVERLAARLGLPLVARSFDVPALAKRRRENLEAVARDVRRSFLLWVAEDRGAARIALGHTQDDAAETTLLHLARGTGLRGLGGLRAVDGKFVRPLAEIPRREIEAFAVAEGISWREDPTNADVSLSRNRIRHRVIPELERMNPAAVEAIARAGRLAREADNALSALLEPVWRRACSDRNGTEILLDREGLRGLPAGGRHALLRRALEHVRGDLDRIDWSHVDALDRLLSPYRGPRRIDLPGAVASVTRGHLTIAGAGSTPQDPCGEARALCAPLTMGSNDLPSLGVRLRLSIEEDDRGDAFPDGGDAEVADADCIAFPLHVRVRRAGDRFRPLGMAAPKRLSEFLIDEKVPPSRRDSLPLVCDRRRIVWVAGVRLSDAVRVTDGTRRRLTMCAEELG